MLTAVCYEIKRMWFEVIMDRRMVYASKPPNHDLDKGV